MEISQHIKDEARNLLQTVTLLNLPIQLSSAPEFYLAKGDDTTVIAFTAILHAGAEYKIGTKKASQ